MNARLLAFAPLACFAAVALGCASLVGVPDVPNPADSGAVVVYDSGSWDGGGGAGDTGGGGGEAGTDAGAVVEGGD